MPNLPPAIRRSLPAITTTLACAGVVTTAVLAAKGHLAAKEADLYIDRTGTRKEVAIDWLRANWRFYAPATVSGVLTVVAILGTHGLLKRNLVGALGALERTQALVAETVSDPEKSALAAPAVKENAPHNPMRLAEDAITGEVLYEDQLTGRYFRGKPGVVNAATNSVNAELNNGDSVSLNYFYAQVGLPMVPLGDLLGWSFGKGLVETRILGGLTEDGRPCATVVFVKPPTSDYDSLW